MKRRYLYIVTSFWAFGELQIAIDFAFKAMALGNESLFLIPPSHKDRIESTGICYRILIPHSATINRVTLRDIEETYVPDIVILSDFLNFAFCEKHYGLTESDLEIFSGAIGAFDLYDYENAEGSVDTYGFSAKQLSCLSLSKYKFILQPSPVIPPRSNSRPNHFRYRIFDDIQPREISDYLEARKKLGISVNENIILMTCAVWQSTFRPYADIYKMVAAVNIALSEIINKLPDNTNFLWVGSKCNDFLLKSSRVHQISTLSQSEFEAYVLSADVYLSMNYISTSMVRAALMGVPVVLLGNTYTKKGNLTNFDNFDPEILNSVERIYPFRMFPVGWYYFLESIVKDNPFYQLTEQAEIFETDTTVSLVKKCLTKNSRFSINALKQFKNEWFGVPSAETVIMSLAEMIGG
jgi:hypothetical protein